MHVDPRQPCRASETTSHLSTKVKAWPEKGILLLEHSKVLKQQYEIPSTPLPSHTLSIIPAKLLRRTESFCPFRPSAHPQTLQSSTHDRVSTRRMKPRLSLRVLLGNGTHTQTGASAVGGGTDLSKNTSCFWDLLASKQAQRGTLFRNVSQRSNATLCSPAKATLPASPQGQFIIVFQLFISKKSELVIHTLLNS